MRPFVEQAKQLNSLLHIRVTRDGNKTNLELMDGQLKIRDVSGVEVVEMIQQFSSSLRWLIQ